MQTQTHYNRKITRTNSKARLRFFKQFSLPIYIYKLINIHILHRIRIVRGLLHTLINIHILHRIRIVRGLLHALINIHILHRIRRVRGLLHALINIHILHRIGIVRRSYVIK